MIRDLNKLNNKEFDLLVIGGGINGVAIAWDAALRGLKVALVEKGDFSGGSSAACFNIVHGGLRYLQHLDISRLLKSANEQKILRKIAGNLVRPMGFVLPTSGYGKKGKAFLKTGTTIYELLTLNKNLGFISSEKISSSKLIDKEQLHKIAPGIEIRNLNGAVIFYDCQMNSSERIVIEIAKAASGAGAVVANYLELLRKEKDKIFLRDVLSNQEIELKAKLIVNATGAWCSEVNQRLGVKKERDIFAGIRFVKGIQLIFPKIIEEYALGIESRKKNLSSKIARGGRSYFLQPWHDYTLAGTYEKVFQGKVSDFKIEQAEVEEFLEELESGYSDSRLNKENLKATFGGLIPLKSLAANGSYQVRRDDLIKEVATDVLSVMGVKYTTFRVLAEKVVNQVMKKLGKERKGALTKNTIIKSDSNQNGNLFDFPNENLVKYFVEEEMAMLPEDILYRRNMLGVVGEVGEAEIARIKAMMK